MGDSQRHDVLPRMKTLPFYFKRADTDVARRADAMRHVSPLCHYPTKTRCGRGTPASVAKSSIDMKPLSRSARRRAARYGRRSGQAGQTAPRAGMRFRITRSTALAAYIANAMAFVFVT